MPRRNEPFFLTFMRDFPEFDLVVGGEQIRPFELVNVLREAGCRGEVWCVEPSSPRSEGRVRVRGLPLPRWAPLRELLAPVVVLAIFLTRAAQYSRVVLCQRIAGGVTFKGRVPFFLEHGWLLFGWARLLRVRTWASVHDLSPEHETNALSRAERAGIELSDAERDRWRKLSKINSRIQRWALPRATRVSVVSESIRREVLTRYPVDPERVDLIRAGINPEMIERVPRWEPPTHEPWTIGYLGSRHDLELEVLSEAMKALDPVQFRLLVAGRGADELDFSALHSVQVVDSRYADFARLAANIDIWVVPIESDQYLNWGWHLKLPMDVATARPVVLPATEELELSGLHDLFFVASPGAAGLAETIREVVAQPEMAAARARNSAEIVRTSMTWRHQFARTCEALGLPST